MMDLVEDLSANWLGWWIENLHWEHTPLRVFFPT